MTETTAADAQADAAAPAEVTIDQALQLVLEFVGRGEFGEAGRLLERILDVEPDNVAALNYQGIVLTHLGAMEKGAALLDRAAGLAPDHAGIRNNIANVAMERGDVDAAEKAYRRAMELDPTLSDPYSNLASIMRSRGQAQEAEAMLRRALEINNNNGFAHHNLATLLMASNRAKEAITHFWRAAAHMSDKTVTPPFLALAYWHADMKDEAMKFVRGWAEAQPDDAQAQHLRASMTGEDIPDRASDDYVARLFDRFASSFDSKLDQLEYQAPALVGAAVEAALGEPQPRYVVVDAGCGTGKCARYLKPYARELIGVDLSGGMLERADRLRLYTHLERAELTGFLEENPGAFDVIVSADTLCYFGRIEAFSHAAFAALRGEGLLAFSVEALEDSPAEEFRLAFHGRYAHSRDYVERTLAQAGFAQVQMKRDKLRTENGEPVTGFVVSARKSVRK